MLGFDSMGRGPPSQVMIHAMADAWELGVQALVGLGSSGLGAYVSWKVAKGARASFIESDRAIRREEKNEERDAWLRSLEIELRNNSELIHNPLGKIVPSRCQTDALEKSMTYLPGLPQSTRSAVLAAAVLILRYNDVASYVQSQPPGSIGGGHQEHLKMLSEEAIEAMNEAARTLEEEEKTIRD